MRMTRISVSLDLGQRVSSTLSILLILILSVSVAFLALRAAQNILDVSQLNPAFNVQNRHGVAADKVGI